MKHEEYKMPCKSKYCFGTLGGGGGVTSKLSFMFKSEKNAM